MSMIYCEACDANIDTDFNAEHFDDGCEFQDLREILAIC